MPNVLVSKKSNKKKCIINSFVSKKSTRTAITLLKFSPSDSHLFPELKQILGGHKVKADLNVEQLGRDE
jgi:hypothetical protein